ncbi:MAG: lytic transglycosylase [Betaproteobacteria bacterium HGW-Betaproteobacteria-4]|jgi:soluble lytic murein transglycosylase|nr:MAG: lytic transglycosylase [Betaproteobacteria bacterium HGW-Betaproteobacteria-4]
MKFCLILVGLALPISVIAQGSGDSDFLTAREAFQVGDSNKLERAIDQLGQHELAAYAENYRLRMGMEKDDPSGLRDFLRRNDGSYVAEKLRADWIRSLGKRLAWDEVDAEFPKLLAPEADVTCYSEQARLARFDKKVLGEAEKRWLTMLEPPEPCRPVFDALVANQRITNDEIWQRARRQIEANRPSRAKTTLDYLPENQIPDSRSFDSAIGSAMSYLVRQPANWSATRTGRELAAIAVARLATNDPRIAADELDKIKDRLHDAERQWAWSQIALLGARRHLPEALGWYANADQTPLSHEGIQWKVRAALRTQDWGVVRTTIEAMPAELAAKPEWIYWLGRALKSTGRTPEANALFDKIAGQPNFYGNLADEELDRQITLPPNAKEPTLEETSAASDNPGIRRALAFFRLDLRTEAVREWNWALRGMNDRELLAAANLAKRKQIWDRAINTADRTRHEHDYSLRFLAPFGDTVRPAAHNQSLDDAWVYGLMRQESRFITNAKSTVGASGLMQLMPATAKWVAKKIGLRDFKRHRVNDTETNVLLGTSYMRLVMENLDNHPVLASAAYNAGPGRAKKWRADQPLEGAIYAETIPFSETRDYVKKVMSNAVYYSAQFNGKADSLKTRLGVVGARTSEGMKDADLP